jgi:hypothetical protein
MIKKCFIISLFLRLNVIKKIKSRDIKFDKSLKAIYNNKELIIMRLILIYIRKLYKR